MASVPTEPGYYWAKLKTPSGGNFYCEGIPAACQGMRIEPEGDSWQSTDWEIVEVNENGGDDPEEFLSVQVFGVPITQWPGDFYWGPRVQEGPPV